MTRGIGWNEPINSAKHAQVKVAVIVQRSQGSCHHYFHLLFHTDIDRSKKKKLAKLEATSYWPTDWLTGVNCRATWIAENSDEITWASAVGRGWLANGKQLPTLTKLIATIIKCKILYGFTFWGRQAKSLAAAPWFGLIGRTYKNEHLKSHLRWSEKDWRKRCMWSESSKVFCL